jgi:hypothetical protein
MAFTPTLEQNTRAIFVMSTLCVLHLQQKFRIKHDIILTFDAIQIYEEKAGSVLISKYQPACPILPLIQRVRLNALQLFTSCTPIWSGKVCTPMFLEWEAVHSNIFGVGSCPLQYIWSGHLSTPKFFTSLE